MTVRHGTRFRFLAEACDDSPALLQLEHLLALRSVLHKRRKVARSNRVRLLVAKRDYDIAFRVLCEWTQAVQPAGISDVELASASRSPVAGE